MKGLSKSKLLAHRQCPKRLWLQTYRPELGDQSSSAAVFSLGHDVGEVARSLHPKGVLIEGSTLTEALELTQQALQATQPCTLFETAFEHDRVLVRADVLLPSLGGYRLVEAKSSTSVKDYHYLDVAVQTWVIQGAGLRVSHIEIAHIDTTFVYPGHGNYEGLFRRVDVTKDIDDLQSCIPAWVRAARNTLVDDEPDVEPGDQCHDPFDCPFMSYCHPQTALAEDGYPPETLPRGGKVAAQLRAEGYDDLRTVPDGYLKNATHERVRQACITGKAFIDTAAKQILQTHGFPRYYFDFESVNPGVPMWAGTRPYQQVPFQWSCHREARNGTLTATAYLAADASDPRRACAESLLTALGTEGPIYVYYAPFERSRLEELAAAFPGLRQDIAAVIERLVDLLPLAQQYYYHPDMRGSWSIKKVLPTVAPDLSYETLMVGDGGMAQEAYIEMVHPSVTDERRAELRQALLDYCGQDTMAMVRLVHFFEQR